MPAMRSRAVGATAFTFRARGAEHITAGFDKKGRLAARGGCMAPCHATGSRDEYIKKLGQS